MITHALRSIAAGLFVLALGPSIAAAQPQGRGGLDVPAVPAGLEVPAGHTLYFIAHAAGTQNYVCLPEGEGAVWKFLGPQATLFARTGEVYRQTATHFLSPNPAEAGAARVTWQHSDDSSQVWGRLRAASSDPMFVEPGAIAWLLVEAAGAEPGPAGGTVLAETTFIQRVNTSGGAAPSGGCSTVGAVLLVPYTTDYYFYRADRAR